MSNRSSQFGNGSFNPLPLEAGLAIPARTVRSGVTLLDTETGEITRGEDRIINESNPTDTRNSDVAALNALMGRAESLATTFPNVRVVSNRDDSTVQGALDSIVDATATKQYEIFASSDKYDGVWTPKANIVVYDLYDLTQNTSPSITNVTINGGSVTNVTITNSTIGLTSLPIHDCVYHDQITADQTCSATGATTAIGGTTASTWKGQTFVAGASKQITHCELFVTKVGTPTDGLYVALYDVTAGLPSGTLRTYSAVLQARDFGSGEQQLGFFFPRYAPASNQGNWLIAGNTYAIVIVRTGAIDADNYYNLTNGSGDVYASGQVVRWDGTNWNAGTSGFDLKFTTYYGETTYTGFVLDQLLPANGILPVNNLGTGTLGVTTVLQGNTSGSAVWTSSPSFTGLTINNITIGDTTNVVLSISGTSLLFDPTTITSVDFNGLALIDVGPIDSITPLYIRASSGGFYAALTFGGTTANRGFTLQDVGDGALTIQTGTLTATRIPFAGADGILADSSVLTFTTATGNLTATSINDTLLSGYNNGVSVAGGDIDTGQRVWLLAEKTGSTNRAIRFQAVIDGNAYYTMPASNGTLALTSDIPSISGLVPYTGASGDVNLGGYSLSADILIGVSGIQIQGSGTGYALLDFLGINTNRAINFPDAAGTLALTSLDSTYMWVGNVSNLQVATSPADVRTTLGLVIGTNVQAWDAQLDDIAGLTPTDNNIIVGNGTNWVAESGATARTSLGLGTIATAASGDYALVGQQFYIGTTQVAINRASAALTLTDITLTSPTLTTPVLGTPSSGNLASCTGYVGTTALTTIGTLVTDVLISKVTPMFKGTHTTDSAYYSLYRSGAAQGASTILDAQTYKPGALGYGVNFAPVNDFISCGIGPAITGSMSIIGWILIDVDLTSQSVEFGIVSKGTTSWPNINYMFYGYSGAGGGIAFAGGKTGGGAVTFYTGKLSYTGLNDNGWHHFACVFDKAGQTAKIYIDTVDIGATTSTMGNFDLYTAGTQALYLGTYSLGAATAAMDGSLDEVVIWDKALSTAEISADYAAGVGVYHSAGTNIKAIYHLDENTGTATADSGGSGYNGTLTNGPTWVAGKIYTPGALSLENMISLLDGSDAGNVPTLKLGAANNDNYSILYGSRFGFYGATPVTKSVHIADATDAATAITRINAILVVLENLGLTATS